MSRRELDGTSRILRLLARKLEEYLAGDELAFETLGEVLEQLNAAPEEVESAIMGIRGLAGVAAPGGWIAGFPDRHAQRVLSAEERDSLTTEAWGYLLGLRASGTLDADQFERVLEAVIAYGEHPVEVERARQVAVRVAMDVEDGPAQGELAHGDQEVAH